MINIKITEGQLRELLGEIYFRTSNSFDDVLSGIERTPLMEAYFATYPTDTVIKFMKRHFFLTDDYQEFVKGSNDIQGFITRLPMDNNEEGIGIIAPEGKIIEDKIKDSISLCGFYESEKNVYCQIGDITYNDIHFEKRFQEDITEKINANYKYLYHVSLKSKEEKIKQNGLVPKANCKKGEHPYRIYLIPSNEPINKMVYSLYQFGKQLYPNEVEFIACCINVGNLDNHYFYDPNAMTCIYTKENIPPQNFMVKDLKIRH